MIQDYQKAKKLGERAYRHAVAHGQYPYLPSLEDMVRDVGRYPEISLGTAEVPIEMIVGTRTSGRQNAFAWNFMPLMGEDTEFAMKWNRLYDAQVEEGIRDPVKLYEFENHFYVEEGNKRVSVMRFLGAVSIPANVIRIRPPRTDTEQSRIYYEYLDFYRVTGMFGITFSKPGRYEQLARILQQNLNNPWPEELLEKLQTGLTVFREIFRRKGGMKLGLTVGDAFLIYLGFYSLDSLLREGNEEIGRRILRIWHEFAAVSSPYGIALIERREDAEAAGKKTPLSRVAKAVEKTVEKTNAAGVAGAAELAGAVAGMTGGSEAAKATRDAVRSGLSTVLPMPEKYSPSTPLRIAFIYDKNVENSGWVYGHELGRNHLHDSFGSLVRTAAFFDCRDDEAVWKAFSAAKEDGYSLIFATSHSMTQTSVRFAVENPQIRVLNCSYNQAKQAVRFYFGKMYEAKFLMGALAASLTDDHRIRYVAGRQDPAAIANINAFALGAQLTDPYSRIELEWTPAEEGENGQGGGDRSSDPASSARIHVFSDIDMVRLGEEDRKYGLYLRDNGGREKRIAASIWNWGLFYEIIVRKVLNGTYEEIPDSHRDRALNYWLGMSSGLIDIIFSDDLPKPSYRLIRQLRTAVTEGRVHPFAGCITAQDGTVHGREDGVLSNEEIMSMDWLAENVEIR